MHPCHDTVCTNVHNTETSQFTFEYNTSTTVRIWFINLEDRQIVGFVPRKWARISTKDQCYRAPIKVIIDRLNTRTRKIDGRTIVLEESESSKLTAYLLWQISRTINLREQDFFQHMWRRLGDLASVQFLAPLT